MRRKLIIKFNNKEILFLFAFTVVSFLKSLGFGSGDNFYQLIMTISIFLCLIKFSFELINGEIDKKRLMILILIFSLLIANYYFIQDITFLITFVFILSMKNTSLIRIFKWLFFSKIMAVIFNFLLLLFSIRENVTIDFYREGVVERNSYGLGHPNFLHYVFLSIFILYLVIYNKTISIYKILVFLVLNYFLYLQTLSRTSYYTVIIICILYYLIKYNNFWNIFKGLSKYIQLILLFSTYYMGKFLNEYNFLKQLDILLTGRLTYTNLQMQQGIKFFGNNDIAKLPIIFDNSYSMLYSYYGIFITMLCMYIYLHTIKVLVTYKIKILVLFMFIFSIILFSESYYPSNIVNLSWLIIGKIFWGEIKNVNEEFK